MPHGQRRHGLQDHRFPVIAGRVAHFRDRPSEHQEKAVAVSGSGGLIELTDFSRAIRGVSIQTAQLIRKSDCCNTYGLK